MTKPWTTTYDHIKQQTSAFGAVTNDPEEYMNQL